MTPNDGVHHAPNSESKAAAARQARPHDATSLDSADELSLALRQAVEATPPMDCGRVKSGLLNHLQKAKVAPRLEPSPADRVGMPVSRADHVSLVPPRPPAEVRSSEPRANKASPTPSNGSDLKSLPYPQELRACVRRMWMFQILGLGPAYALFAAWRQPSLWKQPWFVSQVRLLVWSIMLWPFAFLPGMWFSLKCYLAIGEGKSPSKNVARNLAK